MSEEPQVPVAQPEHRISTATIKSIADLEYDLMVAEGHVDVYKRQHIVTSKALR